MKIILIALCLTTLTSSAFGYDLSCDASRYMGLKKYQLKIIEINTDFGKRSGILSLSNSTSNLVNNLKVSVSSDYMDGESLINIETRDLLVIGYINMATKEGDLEIDNKNYKVDNCEYKR